MRTAQPLLEKGSQLRAYLRTSSGQQTVARQVRATGLIIIEVVFIIIIIIALAFISRQLLSHTASQFLT